MPGLDRVFSTPTITVDQDKYDSLIETRYEYNQMCKKEICNQEKVTNFDFGKAIKLIKNGKRVQRKGWNGKGQYIELATNISYKNAKGELINAEHEAIGNKAIAFVGTSGVQLGWLASQADMLAEDWKIAESEEI
ncbi:MAG: DUF2829 domain-containing protein [Clostridia bacterium]|jgi:hypothetical protein|nr:DUF2829 domain-containing protein [Clostridia bacterium]